MEEKNRWMPIEVTAGGFLKADRFDISGMTLSGYKRADGSVVLVGSGRILSKGFPLRLEVLGVVYTKEWETKVSDTPDGPYYEAEYV